MIGIAVGQTITGSATPLVTLRSRALIIVPASRGTGRLESKASALDRQAKAEALDSK
jgi:hypothetical protein